MSHARAVTEANLLKLKEINGGGERGEGCVCPGFRISHGTAFGNPNGIGRVGGQDL
jgi:hypothetical protein